MPQWRAELIKSLHKTRSIPESRYFQLATVDNNGLPFCRTVVYRGLTDNNDIVVISDTRTDKYTQLNGNNKAQICWYFAKTREQYRFSVTAQVATLEDNAGLVQEQWSRLSDAGKKQFLWGQPRTPRNNDLPLRVNGDYACVPTHFCVLVFNVEQVDYLSLRGNPQYRALHYCDERGNWHCQSVIP